MEALGRRDYCFVMSRFKSMQTRRTLIAGLAATVALATPALAQQRLSLQALSRYLNEIQTATSPFTQVNGDGTISTGTIFIKRPGQVRFEYDPPDNTLVLAGGGSVAIFDPKSNTPPEQYPLRRTPLNLILARTVNLGRSGMVVGHGVDGPATVVTARDPEQPEIGTIQLKFTSDPVELRQWVITDETGQQTTVILGALKKGGSLGAGLFSITQEMNRRLR